MYILVAHPLCSQLRHNNLENSFLSAVLPLLGVAGSVGHEVVVNVEAAVLGCEEPHVGHGLLHLIYYVQMLNQAI